MAEELDVSWIRSLDQELNSEHIPQPTLLSEIPLFFHYIDGNQEIIFTEQMTHPLEKSTQSSQFLEPSLLSYIEKKKSWNNKKFGFLEIQYFSFQVPSNQLIDFINHSDDYMHVQTFKIPQTIAISPSLFLLHSLHEVHIFFQELELIQKTKSILRKEPKKKRSTKKVRISSILPSRYGIPNNKTQKSQED